MITQVIVGLVILGSLGYQCWQAASGRGHQSRLGWLLSAVEAGLTMIVARLLLSWALIPPLLWMLPVMIIAATAVLVIGRWSQLPWLRSDRRPAGTITRTAIGAAVMLAVGGLLLG